MDQTLRHKIGQMVFAGFPSQEADDQAKRLVSEYEVGNFVLFGRNLSSVRQACSLCGALSALAYEKTGLAPFIAADQEGGAVTRISEGAALFPGTMALAASPSGDAYQVGKNCAQVLRAMGINTNFAPVLDVNLQPLNPIIGARAFSDDPQVVSRLGIDMMTGLKDGGMLSGIKHYPGHGNVKSDSHLGVPVNDTPARELEQSEWVPFQNAFWAGAEALMTCHVLYREIDPDHPATLSSRIMTELLRNKQLFRGLVITDCLEMDAIRAAYGIAEGAVLAVEAGCDMLTFSHTFEAVEQAVLALYAAVESGRISPERIDRSYRRIVEAKRKYGLLKPSVIDPDKAQLLAGDPEKNALHARISRESITLLSDRGGMDLFRRAKNPLFLAPASLALTGAEDQKPRPLCFSEAAVSRFGGRGRVLPLNEWEEKTAVLLREGDHDVAVLGLYNARFREGQIQALRELERQGRPLVVVLLGAPYDAALLKRADAVVAAYEYTALSVPSVLQALEEGTFSGRLPVKL